MADKRVLLAAIAAVAAFASAIPVFAADTSGKYDVDAGVDCRDPQDQLSMNICSSQAYAREDKLLNKVYQAYRAKFSDKARADLTAAQKSWLTYRDTECAFEASQYEGGSIEPMIRAECLDDLTKARRTRLESLLKDMDH